VSRNALLSQKPEQERLGADVAETKLARLGLRERNNLAAPRCEPLKHAHRIAAPYGFR
jgi:hypothetical protein